MKPPVCERKEHKITQHGQTRVDYYSWLRDENWKNIVSGEIEFKDDKVKKYIDAENSYKEFIMRPYKDTEKKVYDELLSRINENKESYPTRDNGYYYFEREKEGLNYPILCRFKHEKRLESVPVDYDYKAEKESAEVYFDVNKEAEGHDLYSLRRNDNNKSNSYFAYMYNLSGSMEGTLKVRDLKTGKDFPWSIQNTTGSFTWVNNDELYYIERDEDSRGRKIFKINVHEGPSSKKLVFEKPKEYSDMFMSLSETTDEKFFIIYLTSGSTLVTYVSERTSDKFERFIVGKNDISHSLEHYGGEFYILTNEDDAEDFKVMKTSVDKSRWDKSNWVTVIEEVKGKCLNEFHVYSDFMITERKNNEIGLPELCILDLKNTGEMKVVKMPQAAYTVSFRGHWDHLSNVVEISFNTPVSSSQIYDLELKTSSLTLKHTDVTPNFDGSKYVLKRELAEAGDGALIPLTIIHKKDIVLDGSNPSLVYAYGSYGYGMPAYFSSTRFSLIDRGFVYCIAHIRGGDEKGNSWYLDGKMHNKLNTFHDYIDSCEYLIAKNYTSENMIAAHGGSAGGLLMGAVANMRPDLFRAVIADVAFVDVINTISDPSLPLTPPEWEEWGNPIENKEDFEYMMSYSPYDNVKSQKYPAMLFNSGISDEQVTYWEPTKMIAKLREMKTDSNDLLLNMKMHAGHSGASKKYEWIEEIAFNYAFLLKQFDLK